MESIEGFTRVDQLDPTKHGVYGSIFDIEFAKKDGHDLEKLTRDHVEWSRRTMDKLGVPESRRMISINERTNPEGRKIICVECADSESAPHEIPGLN